MFFFVDESGNSGNNLFDENQPVLSYGVLSSKLNVDVVGKSIHARMLRELGEPTIHANKLGIGGLSTIAPLLLEMQRSYDLRFDYYFIHKRSYAVVMLFDAIFDAGLNEAVKWEWYWTPLRFPVVAALDDLADDDLLKEAWELKLVPTDRLAQVESRIVNLVSHLLDRLAEVKMDKRLKEIVKDGLLFAKRNPLAVDFGSSYQKLLSPNAVGFQFVLASIARRRKSSQRKILGITVDLQTQFNKAQLQTFVHQSKIYAGLRANPEARKLWTSHPLHRDVGQDAATLLTHFPDREFTVSSSGESIGLQLTDVFLWLLNRVVLSEKSPGDLGPILACIFRTGALDGISMSAMMGRFKTFFAQLPDAESVPAHIREMSEEAVRSHRAKVDAMDL